MGNHQRCFYVKKVNPSFDFLYGKVTVIKKIMSNFGFLKGMEKQILTFIKEW